MPQTLIPPAAAALSGQEPSARPNPATPAFSPLYQQIKGLILNSLRAGEWKPGEAIPSEMELAARYRVSQGSVGAVTRRGRGGVGKRRRHGAAKKRGRDDILYKT